MTRDQYIESLVAQGGLSSKEMYAMTKEWEAKNQPREKVKSNDPAVEAETNVGSEDGTVSESESGSSEPPIMPGTVITKGDKDFKFIIDPETNQGIYFSKPAGDDDARWIRADKEDDRGLLEKASIAYHFGHSDMDEKKVKQYEDHFKAQEEFKKKKKEALKKYAEDEKLGWTGMITGGDGFQLSDIFNFEGGFRDEDGSLNIFSDDARWGEAISRFAGEGVELAIDAVDFATDRIMDVTLEPIAGALHAMGVMDFSDYTDDSFVGVDFDNIINDTVAEFVIGDAAYTGQKDALGREKGKYDFGEEVGDLVESGVLSIGAAMMAAPQLLADTKQMIGDTLGIELPEGAQKIINSPLMMAVLGPTGKALWGANRLTQKDVVEAGEEAYNVFSKKAEQLNMTLADFGDVGMSEMMADAFTGGDAGDYSLKKRIGSFVAGSTRITASALGSLPSVAQSMIPYVGIASIVVGEAARTNMESKQDGRPLDWARLGHAYTTGASEGLLELVTKKIGMGMFKGLRGGGKEAIEQTLRQYGTKVMKEFGQEGLSEVGTLLINQIADAVYKDEVTEYFPKWGELIDTFLIGGVMGGGMSSAGVGGQILRNTIARKNIKGNLNSAGYKNLSGMFDSINPLSEGGLSQEIASGMEDSTSKRQRLEDTKRIKQTDDVKTKPSKTQIEGTTEVNQDAAREYVENKPATIKEQNVVETVTIKDGKPVTELTVDEKADAAYDVLTNPSTEMFLNTELKREVEAGRMTTTKAEEIKANFKAQQGAANRMQGLGYTGQQRQKAIGLLAEEESLQQEIKQVNNKSLTETQQARIDEINNELKTIRTDAYNKATAEQQAKIDEGVEKDLEFTKKVTESEDGTFTDPVGENKAVQTFESTQEFLQFAKDKNIPNVDAYTDALVLPNGQILINKQHMREAGAVGAGRHEVLHKILKSQFTGVNLENGRAEKLKNEFLKILKETDPKGYKLLIDTITYSDEVDGRLYTDEYLKENPDEYLTIYASLLMEGKIPLETFEKKPSLIKRLGNFFSSIFADAANENPAGTNVKASDIGFESGQDLYDFVKGYVKDSESGVLSERAQKLSDQGREGGKSKTSKSKIVDVPVVSKARQADLDKMTINQRYAEDGYLPFEMKRRADGRMELVQDFVGRGAARAALKQRGEPTGDNKVKFSKTPYFQDRSSLTETDARDYDHAIRDKKMKDSPNREKSEKEFIEFHRSSYDRNSEKSLEESMEPNPLDGIKAIDKQLAKLVRDSGNASVYAWFWEDVASQPEEHNRRTRIYKELLARKAKIEKLELDHNADELRAKYKRTEGKAKEDIKLAIQEKFKKLPSAVIDSGIDIYTGKPLPQQKFKFSKTAKTTPLEAINNLIPADIKTKEQFDNFMRNNKTAKVIADAMLPGGVINNYIRSRETSREQGNKMLDEMFERIFNFNPEAKRADGTMVGPKGFGESIFANTRFAKMVANKALAEKSERQKQEKRIDSKEAKEVADDTKETKVKDDKLAKKPSETTNLGKEIEAKITKAVNKWAKTIEGDIGFAETRNIPQAVAEIYGELFGFNPGTLVDKKRNFQKTDARGLTKAKQFLIKNAQSDHARMVELKNDMGKGTFVPNNVKNALFKDGKFTGTLKQYLDLINEKATKPIYRDRTAQTIKGLLALHIRNRMLETAQPVQGKRIQSGAKFSKSQIRNNSIHKVHTEEGFEKSLKEAAQMTTMGSIMKMLGAPMKTINDANRKTIVDDFIDSIKNNPFIISPLLAKLNLSNFGARNLTGKDWGTKQGADGPSIKERREWNAFEKKNEIIENAKYYRVHEGGDNYTFMIAPETGLDQKMVKQLLKKTNPKTGKKYTLKEIKEDRHSLGVVKYANSSNVEFREAMEKKFVKQGVKPPPPSFVPARGGMFWGKGDRNYEKALKLAEKNDKNPENEKAVEAINAAKRINIDPATGKPDPKGKNPDTKKTWTKAELDNINKKARNATLNQITKAVKNGMPIETAGMLVNKGYQGTNSIFKITIPFVGESTLIMTQGGLTEKAMKRLASEGGPFSEITTEEHSPPVSMSMGQWMVGLAHDVANMDNKGEFTTNERTAIQEAIDREAVQVVLDIATDVALNENGFRDKVLEGQTIKTKNVAWNRLNRANHEGNPSPLEKIELENGKTAAEKTGITPNPKFSKSFKNNPSALNYQQKLINDNAIDPEALTTKDAKDRLNISMPVQILKNDRVIKNSNLNPDIMVPTVTAEKMKTVMLNSFKTRVKASKSNPKRKGISVFDFDDTLARTKEKVIVNMIDGTTKEISAAQFAKQAGTLTEQGAEFDFSNFENVAKGTKEGPLADLARKRQGKFGSGDIFVLTARPNSAGPAIQAFLKSIGIDIPLQNITGLSDGTAQAKADWVLNKTAEGYNDFYFADDSFANVAGVKAVLDAVDVKNKVQQAKFSKSKRLNKEMNVILEEVTGVESFKQYSDVRARLKGKKKDGGLFKRFLRQFTITPSADDFAGLTYAFRGTGEQGNRHAKWIEDNLIKPYDKAELELMSAKKAVANDFAALKKQFPNLRTKRNSFGISRNPLLAQIGVGPFTKSQAVRVYMWNKQGMDIPGMSKRDIADLVKAVEADNELNIFADEVILIQKDAKYPPPQENWMAGDMKSDILNGMDKGFRQELLAEWNENIEAVFTPELYNKLEALYGSKYVEALKDSIRRMRSGSNRPIYTGGGARIVNDMLDWLNASVGATMFINQKSGLLQTLSAVNFINWGDNNIYAAAKAFASKDFYPTFLKLMNSDYLVNRRDGLKINVNEAELVDAGKKGGFQGMVSYLLDKGFVITRIMDSLAIASGGATFFINRKAALQKRVNPETGKLYTEAEAEAQAFEDFYAIAEETQQSSNPSKISQQQASLAGRVLLSFQNVTMQFNRKTKKSILDFIKRRKKPGMTQRESDMSNLSSVMYYVGMQNLIFHSLQQALFAGLFDDDEEEDKNRAAGIANGMVDSLLFGLGFGGAGIATIKNLVMRMHSESKKKSPDYEEPLWDIFDVSPVLDSKVRKLRQAAKSFSWNMKEIKRRGWSLDNPAYLAVSQIVSAFLNLPADRVLNIANNMSNAMDEETRVWQKVALTLGWSPYILGLPYWGRQSTIDREAKEDAKLQENYKKQVQKVKKKGFTKKIPLSGPNHYKPEGQSGVDFMQVERPDGTIQYYVKP